MQCRACRSDAHREAGQKDGIRMVFCECGSLNADIGEANLPVYSDFYRQASFETPSGVAQSLAEVVETVAAYRTNGAWLDIGFGEGGLLSAASRSGWACSGAEISRASLDFGRSRGWDVRSETSSWADGSFDVVSLIEIVEHVPDPWGLVSEAVRLLRPGGALLVTTPNVASITFRVRGLNWSVVAPPEHITLFSPRALRGLVEAKQMRLVSLRTTGLNPSEISQGALGETTPASRNAGAQEWVAAASKSPSRRIMKKLANSLLSLFRSGETLKLLAIKPETAR